MLQISAQDIDVLAVTMKPADKYKLKTISPICGSPLPANWCWSEPAGMEKPAMRALLACATCTAWNFRRI